ncbi:capsid protein [Salmonella enterica]|nr:capsid protein [Salmonella enterica subsp. arizonae serovar 63:z36:-]ECO8609277.1 capsid protein [Salmonella enterica]
MFHISDSTCYRSHVVCKKGLRQIGDRSIVRALNSGQSRRILLAQGDESRCLI